MSERCSASLCDDEAAAVAAAAGLDEAGLAEDAEALAHGDQRDAEPAGELGFAREPFAGVEHAEHDAVGEALRDLLGAARCRRAGRTRLRVRQVPPSTPCVRLVERIPVEWHRAEKEFAIG